MKYLVATIVVATLLLTACPLPFEFTPDGAGGVASSSVDPANPSVTGRPEFVISESSTGTPIDPSADVITVDRDITIAFESQTRGAVFFYTTDGTPPVPGLGTTHKFGADTHLVFGKADAGTVVSVVAIGPSMYPSMTTTKSIAIDYADAAAPVFTPLPGDYADSLEVTIATSTADATIYYTIAEGGEIPPDPVVGDAGTLPYEQPIVLETIPSTWIIKAVATKPEMDDSAVVSARYNVGYGEPAATPVFGLASGPYVEGTQVTMSTTTVGGSIYYTYTTDGSTPSDPVPGSPETGLYTQPIPLADQGSVYRFNAITVAPGLTNSDLATTTYAVLVTIAVDTLVDTTPTADGMITLREAIEAANSPGETVGDAYAAPTEYPIQISFTAGLTGSLNLAFGALTVSGDMVITGNVSDPTQIKIAGQNSRVFDINAGTVTIQGVTIRNGTVHGDSGVSGGTDTSGSGGAAGVGGGLYIEGGSTSVTIRNSVVQDNAVTGGDGGAGGSPQLLATGSGVDGGGPEGGIGGLSGTQGSIGGWLSGGGSGGSLAGIAAAGGDGGFGGGGGGAGEATSASGVAGGTSQMYGGDGGSTVVAGTTGGGGGAGLGAGIFVRSGKLSVMETSFLNNVATGGAHGVASATANNGTDGTAAGAAIFVYAGAVYVDLGGNAFGGNYAYDGSSTLLGASDLFVMP